MFIFSRGCSKSKLGFIRFICDLYVNGLISTVQFIENMAFGYVKLFGLSEVEAIKQAEDDMRRFNIVK